MRIFIFTLLILTVALFKNNQAQAQTLTASGYIFKSEKNRKAFLSVNTSKNTSTLNVDLKVRTRIKKYDTVVFSFENGSELRLVNNRGSLFNNKGSLRFNTTTSDYALIRDGVDALRYNRIVSMTVYNKGSKRLPKTYFLSTEASNELYTIISYMLVYSSI
jgi:hypothetical protein